LHRARAAVGLACGGSVAAQAWWRAAMTSARRGELKKVFEFFFFWKRKK